MDKLNLQIKWQTWRSQKEFHSTTKRIGKFKSSVQRSIKKGCLNSKRKDKLWIIIQKYKWKIRGIKSLDLKW